MGTPPVIRASGLGKRYRLGEHPALFGSLRDFVGERLAARGRGRRSGPGEIVWALRDVDLEVREGEVLGVIGRNGSGKTTLLKVLSRITEPTTGRVELRGRVGSLLEVGTGFHPELTGRENVYLSGAILGMGRREIDRKLDEIVAFSGVGAFLDTPVKRYSTGMHLRLGFSVAAHLDPEILLVDEVLAVGDAEFRRRCLEKMDQVATGGRTVLFVSHNLAAVRKLCHRGVLLERGRLVADGSPVEAIRAYSELDALEDSSEDPLEDGAGLPSAAAGREPLAVRRLRVDGGHGEVLQAGAPWEIGCTVVVAEAMAHLSLAVALSDEEGRLVLYSRLESATEPELAAPGHHAVRLSLPPIHLAPGLYSLALKAVGERRTAPAPGEPVKCRFVTAPRALQVANDALSDPAVPGVICPPCRWRLDPAGPAPDGVPEPGER